MQQKKKLKDLAIRGVGFLALERVIAQTIISFSNLILVRLLFPADFGSFAIIQFLVTLSWVFADFSLGRALVQQKNEPDKYLLQSVWWTQVFLGILVASVLWFITPFFVSFYSGQLESQSILWLRLLGISQIFLNMSLVSAALLERQLNYKNIIVIEVLGLLVTQISIIIFAFLQFGVGSFIFGNLLGKIAIFVIYFLISPWAWGVYWKWQQIKPLLGFGIPLQMSRWLELINGAVIPLFLGKVPGPGGFSGPQAVGLVIWASGVAALPNTLAAIIEQILFPLISRLQNKPDLAKKAFERSLRAVGITVFIGSALIIALAPQIIIIIYSPSWLDALISLRLASIQMIIIAITGLGMSLLLAFGESKFYRNMHFLWAVLQWLLTVPLVLKFGFWGVNIAGILVASTAFLALIRIRSKYFKVSYFDIFKIPALLALTVGLIVYAVAQAFPITNFIQLGLVMIAGLTFYLLFIYSFYKHLIIADFALFWEVLRNTLFFKRDH